MRNTDARNRADMVRRRRKQEAIRRLSNSAVMATRPVTPITTRGSVMPLGTQRGRPAARRRTEAALSMPGIEVQMPVISFSGPGAKWRFVSFGLSLLLGAALYFAGTAAAFTVAAPNVTGNQRIPSEEISAALGASGTQVFALVPAALERQLRLYFPELSDASVQVGLPNQVQVAVVERKPVIVWNQDGAYTWIDQTGVAFRPRGAAENAIVVQALNAPKPIPVAAADPLVPLPFIPPDLVQAIQSLAPEAPAGSPIIYDERYGLGWTDSRGWQVYFGSEARDMALKLKVYAAMAQMLDQKGIRPAFIDVEYPSAPYYRMTH